MATPAGPAALDTLEAQILQNKDNLTALRLIRAPSFVESPQFRGTTAIIYSLRRHPHRLHLHGAPSQRPHGEWAGEHHRLQGEMGRHRSHRPGACPLPSHLAVPRSESSR